jgi:hypothetical protein
LRINIGQHLLVVGAAATHVNVQLLLDELVAELVEGANDALEGLGDCQRVFACGVLFLGVLSARAPLF